LQLKEEIMTPAQVIQTSVASDWNREADLNSRIRSALSLQLDLPESTIYLQENKAKYYDPNSPFAPNQELTEVFLLMRGLNEHALADETICAGGRAGNSFRATLDAMVDAIAAALEGREFDYVELGPEPTKTGFIIERLQAQGARIGRYIGVDINPASRLYMGDALARLLAPERILHRTVSFDRFRLEDIREAGRPVLVTSLGFQEGNEDPASLAAFYRRLLSPDDLLLSEMQLGRAPAWHRVEDFYGHPHMRRFSRLAFERVLGSEPTRGGVSIVPVGVFADEPLWAAVLHEKPLNGIGHLPRLFVSNYCLKYSPQQYRALRDASGSLEIMAERTTGDASVAFQLSRCA